jgi:RNA polymerase sigma factor (sigma-70 family)
MRRPRATLRRRHLCDSTKAEATTSRLGHSRVIFSNLFQIAANLVRNHRRWSKRHPSEPIEALEEVGREPRSREATPDAALSAQDTARAVRRTMEELPEDLRAALVLFTYEEMSHQDIAAALHCSPKAVETRIYRARQILKHRLGHLSTTAPELPNARL